MKNTEFDQGLDSCFEPERRFAILRDIFDSLSEHIAVLDTTGRIVDVNASWRQFAEENPGAYQSRIEGENYIEVCENATGPSGEEAQAVAQGLRIVLAGQSPSFRLEYPCHSQLRKRWFLMTATPLVSHGTIDGTVVSNSQITARKLAEAALIRYERAIASSSSMVSIVDTDFVYQLVNDSYLEVHGKKRAEIEGHRVAEILGRDVFEEHIRPRLERCFKGETVDYEAWRETKSGKRCFAVIYYPYRERDNSISGAVTTATDITEAKELRDEVASSARRLAEAQRLAQVGSFEKDYAQGKKSWSDEFCRILGYIPGEVDPDFSLFMQHIHPEDAFGFQQNFEAGQANGLEFTTGLRIRTVQGEEKHVSLVCGFDLREDGTFYRLHGALADVTQRRLAELRLERLANTDELTGLPNRRHFLESVRAEMVRFERFGKPLCVAMADIDNFKKVNDTHGHDIGDLALRHVARIFAHERRAFDTVGRVGGEEFCILFPETDLASGILAAERVARGLAEAVLVVGDLRLRMTVSVGLAEHFPGESLDALLKGADNAMYEAKRSGKNRVCSRPGIPRP